MRRIRSRSGEARDDTGGTDHAKTGAIVTEPTTYELQFSSDTAQRVRLIEGRRLLNILAQAITKGSYTTQYMRAWLVRGDMLIHADLSDPVSAHFDAAANAGVDYASCATGSVFRTRDPAAAVRYMAAEEADSTTDPKYTQVDGPPNMPGAHRYNAEPGEKYTSSTPPICITTVGRYVIKSAGANIQDAHQRLAAQYKLLAGQLTVLTPQLRLERQRAPRGTVRQDRRCRCALRCPRTTSPGK